MAAKAVAKKRAGGHIKPVPFIAPELPWRSKPEVENEWRLNCTHGGQRVTFPVVLIWSQPTAPSVPQTGH